MALTFYYVLEFVYIHQRHRINNEAHLNTTTVHFGLLSFAISVISFRKSNNQ